jgi:hypothetical protein
MIRDCPGAADYINCGLCKWDPTNNRIVLPNNGWIPRWTTGNNIKEHLDDYYRQNPVPAAAAPVAIPLAPTTGIKDIPLHMSQNLLEVVKNLHAAVSTDPDNTDDDEAIIQALQQAQQALKQKKKKQVCFNGVEMPPMRKGKAPESILKHPDQAGAAKENQSSTTGPSAPVSCITVSTPIIAASTSRNITTTIKNTAASDSSGLQYHYSTSIENPAVVCKVVNRALDVPVSITQRELLSISPEAWKQYKELTMMRRVSAGTMEVGKLEEVPDDSLAVYSGCVIHDPDGTNDLRVGCDSIPLRSIFLLVEGKLTVECILDSGCQIVAMNSIIWEKFGNNLQVERALKMEAANSTITETHGRLRNIRFTFDDIDIYLQVQVMPNAPYDILLSCPFYTLTECITKDFANGDQHLTVTDPNTRQCVMILTKEWKIH